MPVRGSAGPPAGDDRGVDVLASARRAPTVHRSRGRTAKGSKRKWRMALRWVILSISSSGTSARYFMAISGDWGQVESEWG